MDAQLKLSNATLASQLTELSDASQVPVELKAEIAKLNSSEQHIVQEWLDFRSSNSDTDKAEFFRAVRDGLENGEAPGYAADFRLLLADDTAYQGAVSDAEFARDFLEQAFSAVNSTHLIKDNELTLDDLKVAAREHADPKVRDLCARVVADPNLFFMMDGDGNGVIHVKSLKVRVGELEDKVKNLEGEARAKARLSLDNGKDTSFPPGEGEKAGKTEQPTGAPHVFEGSTIEEKTKSARAQLQEDMMAARERMLAAMAQKPPDQAAAQQAQLEMTDLSNAMQTLMQMEQMFMTMMQNIAKLYSEMAMAAVRNIR